MTAAVTIAIDAMSGDEGPEVVVSAAIEFLEKNEASNLILVGDREQLEVLLSGNAQHARISVEHADSVVTMADRPSFALRNKADSSMAKALSLVSDGRADACVSAGNTGALMAMGRSILKMYPGIDRPAITKLFPSQGGGCFVLDLGANVDSTAEHLLQFALMGQLLAKVIKGIDAPKVALMNVGGEAIKGNVQVRLAASLIREYPSINYVGFAEGGDVFRSKADVIVCDGFVGNVALKSAEGAARILLDGIQAFLSSTWYRKLLGKLLMPLISPALKQLDPESHNGAIFLGLQGVLVKSHGNANAVSFERAIDLAAQEARAGLVDLINEQLDEVLL
ncbi:MAG: phosphate acyltransferase PlsX [Oleiphilus sp.]|nr:MAG: phosphate acyltransferase PlsX [Oleiphilus sp.]